MTWFEWFIAVEVLALCACGWMLWCNWQTYRQRIWLIEHRGDDYRALSREWDAVSYYRHLWQLFTFRDPRRLYGPLTQEIWR